MPSNANTLTQKPTHNRNGRGKKSLPRGNLTAITGITVVSST